MSTEEEITITEPEVSTSTTAPDGGGSSPEKTPNVIDDVSWGSKVDATPFFFARQIVDRSKLVMVIFIILPVVLGLGNIMVMLISVIYVDDIGSVVTVF